MVSISSVSCLYLFTLLLHFLGKSVTFITSASTNSPSTVVGIPEVVGGPTCCMFDSPFLGLQVSPSVIVGYTSNSNSYVFAQGNNVTDEIVPYRIGLDPDPNVNGYSHCGKWINAGWVDNTTGIVYAYYHQEWHCDYAEGDYTNKSIGFAVSYTNGTSFTVPDQMTQIIAGSNFSTNHQTGEGDHGVVFFNGYLYLYFLEWNAPSSIHGGTSLGVARALPPGLPNTWTKLCNGSWTCPGVGGSADTVSNMPGTAVYSLPSLNLLMAIGVIFSAPLNVAYSTDGLNWNPSLAGPMFNAGWSNWNRNKNSSELFGYPSLTGLYGINNGLPTDTTNYMYVTYLAPGFDFTRRWMIRRSVDMYVSINASLIPPSLASITEWICTPSAYSSTNIPWVTSGPIVPDTADNCQAERSLIMYTLTSNYNNNFIEVHECGMPVIINSNIVPNSTITALTLDGECGIGEFSTGTVIRSSGWIGTTTDTIGNTGWNQVIKPTGNGNSGPVYSSLSGSITRCRTTLSTGITVYNIAFNDPTCQSLGSNYSIDKSLGYGLSSFSVNSSEV